jgi:outer membrane protein TolC
MKTTLTLIGAFIANILLAQSTQITLKECVENALANKQNIMQAKTDIVIANLKELESKAKFLPEIALAYDYKYNPIIASQIIPVGQFGQVPTNETRAIQFGTNWQQNAGITVNQPVIDATIKSRIKESKINEQIAVTNVKQKEEELKFEVIQSYNSVLILDYEKQAAIKDTMRSFAAYGIISSKFNEGKTLKTELNEALINHNKNLLSLNKIIAAITNEKIYLSFLTNLPLEKLLDASYTAIPNPIFKTVSNESNVPFDSLVAFQQITLRQKLLRQQMVSEKAKQQPTLGFQGFLGANQYTPKLNPVQANSWFGNSYIGFSVALPILLKDKATNNKKQLQTQLNGLQYEKNELQASVSKNILQANETIVSLSKEIAISEENIKLLQENLSINQVRFLSGKITAGELNLQEKELQRETININLLNQKLSKNKIQLLYLSGRIETIL